MSREITMLKPQSSPQFVACIGLDWGDQRHAVALQPVQGKTESCTLVNSPEVLHTWLQELAKRFEGRARGPGRRNQPRAANPCLQRLSLADGLSHSPGHERQVSFGLQTFRGQGRSAALLILT